MLTKHSLNPAQLEAVETLHGPLLVLAGAGSGKTRVVTYRIANLLEQGVNPSAILGLTFTNKAAGEMKERVHHLTSQDVLICTFHSLGARILRESIHVLNYNRNFTIYDEQDTEKLMKLCLSEIEGLQKADVKTFLNYISSSKNALKSPEDISKEPLDVSEKIFCNVYSLYQAKMRECNALDFDDLLFLPVRIFKEFPEVLAHYQKRWSFLLIDEYQDTNAAQYTLVRQLVALHNNLCVVGDPDQSIYSWRGADVENILNFERHFPGAKVVRLEQNYRSGSTILEASNALIGHNIERYEKRLWSDRGAGEKIKHYTADTERGEAEFVAERIRYFYEEHDISLKKMAVFYRTNAQSRALEDRLLLHQVPYVIVGGISFYQRREVKDILAFLRMVQSGVDIVSFTRTINIPKRGIGEATIEKLRIAASLEQRSLIGYCTELVAGRPLKHSVRISTKQKEAITSYLDVLYVLREINKSSSLKELVRAAIERTGYLEYLMEEIESADERKENLNALMAKAAEWENSSLDPSLEGFLEELSLKSSLDEADAPLDRVNLMTIHNGKGLEFDVVFLVGLEEDLFPHANSRETHSALEEERRLCYVGMTRARDYLFLCDVRQRFLWGTTRIQRPSRFLKEIPTPSIERIRPSYLSHEMQKSYKNKHLDEVQESKVIFLDEIDQSVPELEELSVDDAVFHKEFGVGIVRQIYQGSAGLTYKVLFSKDNRERSLVATFARLKKL